MKKQYIPQTVNSKLNTELDSLVKEVLKKSDRIIPIIGDDCFVGEINGINVPLQRWLAEEMLGDEVDFEVKQKVYSDGYKGLDLLCEEYKRINGSDFPDDYKDAVITCIDAGIDENRLSLRQDIKNFLNAGRFDVIVTTCPYHILEREIAYGSKKYNVMSFAPNSIGCRSEATLELPAIYQIFGDYGYEFVFGEVQLLEFLHYLNQSGAEKGFGASPLVKYIRDKGSDNKGLALLMPIGCSNLPDWIFRFLWYPLSQSHKGGIWPNYRDEDFYKFLRKYQFKTFSAPINRLQNDNVNEDPVLNRLIFEFKNRRNYKLPGYVSTKLNVQWNDNDEWDLFISYASEDKEIVQTIYNVLTEDCGRKVWMDNRGGIMPGDNYWLAIQYGIKHSNKFLFVITESYLEKAMDKNHIYPNGKIQPTGVYQEIELIKECLKERRKDGQKGYIVPLIIEGTMVTYTDSRDGTRHINVPMENGMLEVLPKSKEYQMMQTDWLFEHIQDIVCSRDLIAIRECLIHVFGY